jgi:enoyl-CoA hydratase/carnithine racemase
VRHGIVPGLATYRLPRLIGLAAAQEMMLLGETWDAVRAHAQGLVHRVVPLRRLESTANDLARALSANVRAATVATKRLTLRSHHLPLGRFLREYVRHQRACWTDPETKSTLAR